MVSASLSEFLSALEEILLREDLLHLRVKGVLLLLNRMTGLPLKVSLRLKEGVSSLQNLRNRILFVEHHLLMMGVLLLPNP